MNRFTPVGEVHLRGHHTVARLQDVRTARISGCDPGQSRPTRTDADIPAGRRQPGPVPHLNEEELALLRLVAEGLPMDSVAARLGMSPRTARRRMHDLCGRIGVTGTMQAVVWAAHNGLV